MGRGPVATARARLPRHSRWSSCTSTRKTKAKGSCRRRRLSSSMRRRRPWALPTTRRRRCTWRTSTASRHRTRLADRAGSLSTDVRQARLPHVWSGHRLGTSRVRRCLLTNTHAGALAAADGSFMITVMHVRLSALAPARATQKLDGVGGGPAGGELDGGYHAAAVRSSAALEAGRGAGGRKPAVHLVDSRPSGCLAGRSPGARLGRMPGRAAPWSSATTAPS